MSGNCFFKQLTWILLLFAISSVMGLSLPSVKELLIDFKSTIQSISLPSPIKILEDVESTIKNSLNLAEGGSAFIVKNMNEIVTAKLDDMTPTNLEMYDFIIVGAGSAGAVIAARLSEVKNVSVLLIEAGPEEISYMDIPIVAIYLQLYKKINWNNTMEYSPNYCRGFKSGRCYLARGKVMGGSSVLNFMIATRGDHRDYDNWAEMGCDGWSYQDVLPIFKKMENFVIQNPSIEFDYHNTGGPVNIDEAPYRTKSAEAFIKGGKELGFPFIDYEGREMIGYAYAYGTTKNGSRYSSNSAYLRPVKQRTNLFVTRESFVEKVLIHPENGTAYGVEFIKNGRKIRVLARKEVILSAGAINSPQLLMLSGIGPKRQLQQFNIPLLKDAPGVGKNLMDHICYWGLQFSVNQSVTIVSADLLKPTNPAIGDYLKYNKGPLTIIGSVEAVAWLNVDNKTAREIAPDMELIFAGSSVGSDILAPSILGITGTNYETSFSQLKNKQSYMIAPALLAPKSRGRVLLRSNNPNDKPKVIPNYFDHPDDMRRMILGIREIIQISQTKLMQDYGSTLNIRIPGCNELKFDSDDYWDCALRTYASTLYHPSGTCKMGSRNDSTAVVDPRLKVIGIKHLRVADASIMPELIRGHPHVPTMMIGEKLAEMVKEDWGLA